MSVWSRRYEHGPGLFNSLVLGICWPNATLPFWKHWQDICMHPAFMTAMYLAWKDMVDIHICLYQQHILTFKARICLFFPHKVLFFFSCHVSFRCPTLALADSGDRFFSLALSLSATWGQFFLDKCRPTLQWRLSDVYFNLLPSRAHTLINTEDTFGNLEPMFCGFGKEHGKSGRPVLWNRTLSGLSQCTPSNKRCWSITVDPTVLCFSTV